MSLMATERRQLSENAMRGFFVTNILRLPQIPNVSKRGTMRKSTLPFLVWEEVAFDNNTYSNYRVTNPP